MFESAQTSILVAALIFALLAGFSVQMLRKKNYIIFLIWPAFIYLIGPASTLLFLDTPRLGNYVNVDRIPAQTLLMSWYLLLLIIADKVADLSSSFSRAMNGNSIRRFCRSPAFPPIYVSASIVAATLQLHSLVSFGTILTGSYNLQNLDEIPYWGFLSGLYEIVFLCFILLCIGARPARRVWYFYLCLYLLTNILRVLGGTRLILIKELAFILILFYLRGAIKPRQLLIVGSIVIALGSGIGLLRLGGVDQETGFLGPAYGLVMESALNALTLGIADQVNQSGAVARDASTMKAVVFFLLSVVPSFLRLGIGELDMDSIRPFNLALSSGFDTSAPVGGMSGFATINYISSYPHFFILMMVSIFAVWFKLLRNGPSKQVLALLITLNAIHFWRDPTDIAFKLLVQGMLVCSTFYLLPGRRRFRRKANLSTGLPLRP